MREFRSGIVVVDLVLAHARLGRQALSTARALVLKPDLHARFARADFVRELLAPMDVGVLLLQEGVFEDLNRPIVEVGSSATRTILRRRAHQHAGSL